MTAAAIIAPLPTGAPEPVVTIAGRYVVDELLARGGMGEVFRVLDTSVGEVRALKRVRAERAERRALYMAAFEREYQVLASIDHPGIIRVFDYGVDADGPYYTMELVPGADLSKRSPLPWREACRNLRDIASALSLLHARRLVHRDLSPSNVKISAEGRAKLLDFGALADFGYPQWVVGTAPMISPEALVGGMLDQRADLYALGALAYWMLCGVHAYPAQHIDELPVVWKHKPPAPSSFDGAIPRTLDALALGLLSSNALARPASAAEVIAHLEGIAGLEPESDYERKRLAQSFLAMPRFVGRGGQLRELNQRLSAAVGGVGAALRIDGSAGSGRTRLLEELGVRAQIVGATVLRVDASMQIDLHGTSRALAQRLREALPSLAEERAGRYAVAIAGLENPSGTLASGQMQLHAVHSLGATEAGIEGWFVDVSAEKPLVIQVDNVEFADDASLGLLVALARVTRQHGILVVLTERPPREGPTPIGLRTLRELSQPILLPNLTAKETLEHARGMFGGAPNVERFSEWLFALTAGNPLHCVEVSRQLVERGVIAYEAGLWVLPTARPEAELPASIADALSGRIGALSPAARQLAGCLAFQRGRADLALCTELAQPASEQEVLQVLDELAQRDVVQRDQADYRFSSSALSELVRDSLDEAERKECHLRLGRALKQLAQGTNHVLGLEAGWHLIQGGRELEGADIIHAVTRDTLVVRALNANMYRIAPTAEAALQVYVRHGRSKRWCLPLLTALAQAGYFESDLWAEKYADQALEVLEDLSGMRLARRLRFLGKNLALGLALLVAMLRYFTTSKVEREPRFALILIQLFGTVLALAGIAALRLDPERGERAANLLEPFSGLPKTLTAPTVYHLCRTYQEIAREHPAAAYRRCNRLVEAFENPRKVRLIPVDARYLFVSGAHFARAVFATFRDDGRTALESADALDRTGHRLHAMFASQIRFLYHVNRGEREQAELHRAQVEVHAAHFGSAWQVELWEGPALLPLYVALGDASALTRIEHRLEEFARRVPSLARYWRLARFAVQFVRNEAVATQVEHAERELDVPPRSFLGWSAALGVMARAYNELGRHREARDTCERALAFMTDDDREYVTLFLDVDLEAAVADAGLGDPARALARLDVLLARFAGSHHPLTLGRLHEARAQIAFQAQLTGEYQRSLDQVARWFGKSSSPALVAKYERLADLQRPADTLRARRASVAQSSELADVELPTEVTNPKA